MVIFLHEIDPGRAAARDERQLVRLFGEAVDELSAFFHNGDVCTEVGIKDRVKAQAAECSVELAGQVRAGGVTQDIANGYTDCRSNLDDTMEIRVLERLPNLGGIIMLNDGACGAVSGALTAANTGRFFQSDFTGRGDTRINATLKEAQRPDVLHDLTDVYASAAENTLAAVHGDGTR